jgi:hypothetical protein
MTTTQKDLLRVRILSFFHFAFSFHSFAVLQQHSHQATMLATSNSIMIAALVFFISLTFSQAFSPALSRPPPPFVRGTNLPSRGRLSGIKLGLVWGKPDLTANVTNLAQRMDIFKSNTTDRHIQVVGNLTDMGQRMVYVESNATDTSERVYHLESNVTDIVHRVGHLESNATDIVHRVGHLESKSAPAESRKRRFNFPFGIGRNGALLGELVDLVKIMTVKITDLDQGMKELKSQANATNANVKELNQTVIENVKDLNQTVIENMAEINKSNDNAVAATNQSNANMWAEVKKSNANLLAKVNANTKNVNDKLNFGLTLLGILIAAFGLVIQILMQK